MNRYTTKHFRRMAESEQGEWVMYEDYKREIERLRNERDSYRELHREAHKDYCNRFRIGVLHLVLMANCGVIVALFLHLR